MSPITVATTVLVGHMATRWPADGTARG